MAIRRSLRYPEYDWDEASAQYRSHATGRFVSRQAVRDALDAALEASGKQIANLTESLRAGEISLADWQLAMKREIKSVHLASAALAVGGWAQMSPALWGRTGRMIRDQYAWLRGFAADIASGKQKLDGTLGRRARMYVQAGRGTYHAIEQREMRARGMTQEKSIRHASDSCGDCVSEEGRGWVGIGALTPIGSRSCLSRCKCSIEYRVGASA